MEDLPELYVIVRLVLQYGVLGLSSNTAALSSHRAMSTVDALQWPLSNTPETVLEWEACPNNA
jgi:hypothetical protein